LANSRTPRAFASIVKPGDLRGHQEALADRQNILLRISASLCTGFSRGESRYWLSGRV
jgi:hypothetical protein